MLMTACRKGQTCLKSKYIAIANGMRCKKTFASGAAARWCTSASRYTGARTAATRKSQKISCNYFSICFDVTAVFSALFRHLYRAQRPLLALNAMLPPPGALGFMQPAASADGIFTAPIAITPNMPAAAIIASAISVASLIAIVKCAVFNKKSVMAIRNWITTASKPVDTISAKHFDVFLCVKQGCRTGRFSGSFQPELFCGGIIRDVVHPQRREPVVAQVLHF